MSPKYEPLSFDPALQMELCHRWLDDAGMLRLLPAAEFRTIPHNELRAWLQMTGRYGVPTLELVAWLKDQIGESYAIEIGAGNGDLGFHLGIRQTDSFVQIRDSAMLETYVRLGCRPTKPHRNVIEIDAEQAVQRYKPDVVVASWVTRRFMRDVDKVGAAQAFAHGVVEEKILKGCCKYIFIGNEDSHGEKTLLKQPHTVIHPEWLVSRAANQSKNCIYVWENEWRKAQKVKP